jgi:2-succinyl-5-enolpyruvyl-6-hydroxy-3-cyclohexene-1-carboxylate synthase
MTPGADVNRAWAEAIAQELVACGVDHVALSPGNRSAPLALALHEQDGIEVSVHVDERVGAFFALGRACATRRPVATLTTSGTAVANQLPAVIEAHHAGIPLLVLSADRPPRLRGRGAKASFAGPDIVGLVPAVAREMRIQHAARVVDA